MTLATLADTFGTGGNTFTIDFVGIGNPGNAADTTGYGAVPYTYQMGKYEVSRDMITKANNAGGPDIPLQDMSTFGGNVGTHPATGMSGWQVAHFVNWLNTSSGYAAAYKFNSVSGYFDLWTPAEAWTQGGENLYRNKDAHYFLPSENEWYKAAYHNGTGYFDYPTGSDSVPGAVTGGTGAGTAVYGQSESQGPADINNAGGLSPYGTMGQGGNVMEWLESASAGANDLPLEYRVVRGGLWLWNATLLASSDRLYDDPDFPRYHIGFRVAAVPEPEQYAAAFGAALLGTGFWLRRKKVQGVVAK
jgi:formylglycine-generating enzyme